jgi:C4-dicarboxylate transporter/malic acid transport protein
MTTGTLVAGRPPLRQIVKGFAPSWFAAVMGTGVLALTSFGAARSFPFLANLGWALHWFNLALFVVLLVPWTLRWFMFPAESRETLRHPLHASFVPTVAIAMLVVAAQCAYIGKCMPVAVALWAVGTLLVFFFSIVILFLQFRGEHVMLDHVTPGMFIPPVGLVVIPVAGSAVIGEFSGALQELTILLNVAGLGAGFFLYLAFLAITLYRFVLHKPLPGGIVPTVWVNLAPIGVGALSLVSLVNALPFVTVREPFHLLALLLWGFGVWWMIMAVVMTMAYKLKGQLPFALSWWAFTFPLGAYAAASFRLAETFHLGIVHSVGLLAYVMLAALWAITLARSLRGVIDGSLFKA